MSENANTAGEQPAEQSLREIEERLRGKPRVLVGVDGSEDGLRAVRYGAREALAHGTLLHLVHAVDDAVLAGAWGVVYDPTILQEAGEAATAQAVEEAVAIGLPRERVIDEVVLGNASGVLARLSEGAHLVVVGRRSLSGLERMFVGSTSVSVALAAKCPLVVISNAATPGQTGDRGRLVVGIDAGEHSAKTLAWAFAEAESRCHRGFPTSILVTHVLTQAPAPIGTEVPAVAQEGIERLLAPLREEYPTIECQVQLSAGNPVDVLVHRTSKADLFVMGVERPRSIGLMGGVMRGVLAHAQCPVALVR